MDASLHPSKNPYPAMKADFILAFAYLKRPDTEQVIPSVHEFGRKDRLPCGPQRDCQVWLGPGCVSDSKP